MVIEKKVDRRVRKTKKQLRYALTVLLQQKPIQEIKVSEVAELIDINRGTFYQHYDDINDLLNKTEDEVLEEIRVVLRQTQETIDTSKDYNPENFAYDTFMEILLSYIKENEGLIKALFGEYGDHSFIIKVNDLIKQEWLKHRFNLNNSTIDHGTLDYFFSYLAAGSTAIITSWLQNGMKETEKEMSQIITKLVIQGSSCIL